LYEENNRMTHRQMLALCSLCFAPISCCAQSFPGTGLEVDNPKTLSYVIGDLPQRAAQLGVTIQRIRDKVELRLRQAAIHPASESLADYHLVIRISVYREEFHTSIRFVRTVTYIAKHTSFVIVTPAWEDEMDGMLGGSPDSILSSLDPLLDEFLGEFLAVNNSYGDGPSARGCCSFRSVQLR
jgi:hypothetical protein